MSSKEQAYVPSYIFCYFSVLGPPLPFCGLWVLEITNLVIRRLELLSSTPSDLKKGKEIRSNYQ